MVWKALSVRDSISFSPVWLYLLEISRVMRVIIALFGLVGLEAGRFDWRIVVKRANLRCSPLAHRSWANTRAASRKPARIMLKFLINLRALISSIIPVNLISSVILITCYIQINSNHSLGFRGLRIWPCVDATQWVSLVGVWLSEAWCCWAWPETRWQPCLSKICPSFFHIPAVSASSVSLSFQ
jgi:hypothetical protein